MRITAILGIIAVSSLTLGACSSADSDTDSVSTSADGTVSLVATTTQLGSISDQIATCAGGESSTLLPVGADPHDFSPSSAQVAEMVNADLVIANGLSLESGLEASLDQARADGAEVLEVAPEIDPLPFGESEEDHSDHDHGTEVEEDHSDHDHGTEVEEDHSDHDHEAEAGTEVEEDHSDHDHGTEVEEDHSDHDHGTEVEEDHSDHDHGTEVEEDHSDHDHDHDHGEYDPHFWLDASRMAVAAELIGQQVADSSGDDTWADCGIEVRDELDDLNAELIETLSVVPEQDRILVTDHDAFGYFAEAYDFDIIGVVVPGGSTEAEASSQELAELAGVISESGVPAIFSNTAVNQSVVEALAAEVGEDVQVVPLYVGSVGEEGSAAEDYQGMMRENSRLIVEALT
ncbi:metal ABC transporter substrate-binding protein [Corynebacterium alimapuense]|uniref:Zinc ABC transporter substrate-binding protein n=1 Tax=Corynebacterium alimapuense TaxID=1576874 RepID=A0A3M8K9Q8_9CORY|nr:metal ABC transporter substrate-binding protein [Corynebacterium alimapuense]RNE49535.1 zinc ABC transporter substrate-binding protein [Corynebacterium alimapuense]